MMTQTATAFTPTPTFTSTPMPAATIVPRITGDDLKTNIEELWRLANALGIPTDCQIPSKRAENPTLDALCNQELQKVIDYQNYYNQNIVDAAIDPNSNWRLNYPDLNIDPATLAVMYKRITLNESQFDPNAVTGIENGTGFSQVTPDTLRTLARGGYVQLPEGININDDPSLITILKDPAFNIKAGMANLAYLYQGIKNSNDKNGWTLSEENTWKMVAVLHNTGGQSNSLVISVGSAQDFWEGLRQKMENDSKFYQIAQCNDPNDWECLKAALRNYVPLEYKKEGGEYVRDPSTGYYILIRGGVCTSEYAESVAPVNIADSPLSEDVLNVPVRPECKTSVAPQP
jgi:transcriptional regulator with XRE-family HTH domain